MVVVEFQEELRGKNSKEKKEAYKLGYELTLSQLKSWDLKLWLSRHPKQMHWRFYIQIQTRWQSFHQLLALLLAFPA